jgi:hypothetical protein
VSEQYENMIQSLQWDGLRELWTAINARNTPGWQPGKALEYLVLRAFQLDGAEVRWPYSVRLFDEEIEQIDGAIHYAGLSCLIESKDYDSNVDVTPIAKLRNQLLRRPAGALGLVFSRTGFTDPAKHLSYFSLPQAILLWSGEELEYALELESIGVFLIRKYRFSVEYGFPDYTVKEGEVL